MLDDSRSVWYILCLVGWAAAFVSIVYSAGSGEKWPLLFAQVMLIEAGLSHLMMTRRWP